MVDVFTIHSDALPSSVRGLMFTGTEAISRPYEFVIHFSMAQEESADFDMGPALGARAELTLCRADGTARWILHGVFSAIELLHELSGTALYRAVLVPKFWELTLSAHSRVFVNRTVPEILEAVFKAGGLTPEDYTFRLGRRYRTMEHVCQYRESHFDFASRWMEREGIYYYFEQGETRERLVVTDGLEFQTDLVAEPVRYFPVVGHDASGAEALTSFRCSHVARPSRVRLDDYDYLNPALEVTGSAPVAPNGRGEIADHGHSLGTPSEGHRLAAIRAQELLARQVLYRGQGRVCDLRTGYTFELELDPKTAASSRESVTPKFVGKRYLTTELSHQGNQLAGAPEMSRLLQTETENVYHAEVAAISADVQFRPERRTPVPRIYGVESATVDGEVDGPYAQLDAHGRYLVRIRFDEGDARDGKASTRVRMLQPHGGTEEGFHFPLRKGTEVLLVFEGGDPDRPVIAGTVPNAVTPSPVTVANHTRNVLQSGSGNRIELEDAAGGEYIKLYTPHRHGTLYLGARDGTPHNFELTTGTDPLTTGADPNAPGNGLIQTTGELDVVVGTDLNFTIPGRWNITNSAGVTFTNPEDITEVHGESDSTSALQSEWSGMHNEFCAMHNELVIAHYELCGQHTEVIGVHFELTGVHIDVCDTSVESKNHEMKISEFSMFATVMCFFL